MASRRYGSVRFVVMAAVLLLCCSLPGVIEARGGRGRGGGSFGGLFGGLRRYNRPASVRQSRRIVNISGSPMHTTVTKSLSNIPPKQPIMPNGLNQFANGAHLPPGSQYFANAAAMPPGSIFYAQQPMRSSTGDILFGMMAGHALSRGVFGIRSHVMHIHHQQPQQPQPTQQSQQIQQTHQSSTMEEDDEETSTGGTNEELSIVNNEGSAANETAEETSGETNRTTVTEAPFNATITLEEAMELENHAKEPPLVPLAIRHAGIICLPVSFNAQDPEDPTKSMSVLRSVCYPAPSPSAATAVPDNGCVTRVVSEVDPNDPEKTYEIAHKDCSIGITQPPKLFGDIMDSGEQPVQNV